MRVFFLRHGFDTADFKSGWSEVGLDESGKKQAEEAAIYFKNHGIEIKKIISSDLARAKETTNIVSSILNKEVEYDLQFREFNPGVLSAMRYEDIDKDYANFKVGNIKMDIPFPDGESPTMFYERVKECLDNLEDDCLYITHRLVIEVMYHIVNNLDWDMNIKKFPIKHGSLHEYRDGKIIKIS